MSEYSLTTIKLKRKAKQVVRLAAAPLTSDGNTSPTIAQGSVKNPIVLVKMYIVREAKGNQPILRAASSDIVPVLCKYKKMARVPMAMVIPTPDIIAGDLLPYIFEKKLMAIVSNRRAKPNTIVTK